MKKELTLLANDIRSTIWYAFTLLLIGIFSLISPALMANSYPCCVVPADTEVGCSDLPYDFDPFSKQQRDELFGAAGWHGNCNYYNFTELEPIVNLNSCDIGTIVRQFSVVDGNSYDPTPTLCTQTIYVNAVHDYEIKFPADEMAFCTAPDPTPIEYNEIGCDLLAVSTTDMTFNTAVDACYKIFRKYRVINWCEYDGESPAIVVGRDEDCDGIPGDEPVWLQRRANQIIYIDRSGIQFDNIPAFIDLDVSCGHDGQPGYWRSLPVFESAPNMYTGGFYEYTQHIKVTDNVDPEISFTAPDPFCSLSSDFDNGCPGDVTVPFSVIENCTDNASVKLFVFMYNVPVALTPANDQFDELVTGSYPNYTINARLPQGVHSFEIHVNDGCGNSNSELIEVRVVDCKAPAPICAHGLSTSLMPLEDGIDADLDGDIDEAAVEIWATDFVFSPVEDCNGPVSYSINFDGETPNINQSNLVITCEDGDSVLVEIYAWDTAYNPYAIQPNGIVGGPNYDHCNTYIKVTDNLGLCPGSNPIPTLHFVEGAIYDVLGDMVEEVDVYLNSSNPDVMTTQIDGHFSFAELDPEYDYEIIPFRDGDDLNGLSTADLILLAKHLMGISELQSPYLRIAADVDNNGVLNMEDFLYLRDVILEEVPEFEYTASWRFVEESFEFTDNDNPWQDNFNETIMLEDLEEDEIDMDFIAMKMGDLSANAILGHEAYIGFNSGRAPITINLEDQLLRKGEQYTVDIAMDKLEDIAGYQFGITVDSRSVLIESIFNGMAHEQHISRKDNGTIRTSWDYFSAATAPVAYAENELVYSITFKALENVRLSEVIALEDNNLKAEAYTTADQEQAIQLVFTQESVVDQLTVEQAWPNPFKETINVAFSLPEAAEVTISLLSVNGTVVKTLTADYDSANHLIELDPGKALSTGIYYLNIRTGEFNETQRLVKVN